MWNEMYYIFYHVYFLLRDTCIHFTDVFIMFKEITSCLDNLAAELSLISSKLSEIDLSCCCVSRKERKQRTTCSHACAIHKLRYSCQITLELSLIGGVFLILAAESPSGRKVNVSELFVCAYWGRGGGDHAHYMVGNGVLGSRLTVLPFYTSFFVSLWCFFSFCM